MNAAMRRATAVATAAIAAGTLLILDAVRPGVGIAALVIAVGLFAAGGVNDRHRLLWVPFAVVGTFLAALNFTPLDVPSVPTGLLLCGVGVAVLLLAVGSDWLRSVARRARP